MAKYRNVSGEARVVPLVGGRVVEPDEVITVPDQIAGQYVWPEDTWQAEDAPKPSKKKES